MRRGGGLGVDFLGLSTCSLKGQSNLLQVHVIASVSFLSFSTASRSAVVSLLSSEWTTGEDTYMHTNTQHSHSLYTGGIETNKVPPKKCKHNVYIHAPTATV